MSGMDSKKLAVIHIAKSELGMSEGSYRSLLWQTCGVRSAKELRTGEAFKAVMGAFERLGYRRAGGGYTGGHGAQWAKARAEWGELYRLGAVRVKSERYGITIYYLKRNIASGTFSYNYC